MWYFQQVINSDSQTSLFGNLRICLYVGLLIWIFVGLQIPTNHSLHPHRFAWTPIEISVCRFACHKIGPISIRCNPCPLRAVYGRSAGFLALPIHRNIAPGAQPALTAAMIIVTLPIDTRRQPTTERNRSFRYDDLGKSSGDDLVSDQGTARPAGPVRRYRVAPPFNWW